MLVKTATIVSVIVMVGCSSTNITLVILEAIFSAKHLTGAINPQ